VRFENVRRVKQGNQSSIAAYKEAIPQIKTNTGLETNGDQ